MIDKLSEVAASLKESIEKYNVPRNAAGLPFVGVYPGGAAGQLKIATMGNPTHTDFTGAGMALLDSAPRMAAIRTRTPCKMLVLKVRDFAKFLHLFKATGSDFAAALNRTKVLRQKLS